MVTSTFGKIGSVWLHQPHFQLAVAQTKVQV
jgi:hypothetical protein